MLKTTASLLDGLSHLSRSHFRLLLGSLGTLLGALWALCSHSWPLLGPPWALFGPPWVLLGRSWVPLGNLWAPSWPTLGAPGQISRSPGPLGRPQDRSGLCFDRFSNDFRVIFQPKPHRRNLSLSTTPPHCAAGCAQHMEFPKMSRSPEILRHLRRFP